MRAVLWDLPAEIERWRREQGAKLREEVWEGVLHMGPQPMVEHQAFGAKLLAWLLKHWADPTGGLVVHEVNVAHPDWYPDRWQQNYRVPDLIALSPERADRNVNECIVGGPDVVIEIHSPGDESYEKLPFYGEIGVREAWIIHRDSKACEIFRATPSSGRPGGAMLPAEPNDGGWLESAALGVRLRSPEDGRLAIRTADDAGTEALIP